MRKGEAELYLRMYPALQRWLNQCVICQAQGYRPDMPAQIYPGGAAHNLRRLFRPLALDELQMCATCRAAFERT
ncbi:hypothetical protein EJV47_18510 [Hymenobacter gummosus]|uniref:Uncharacterized protein n=1 Tax=Hymenobacter gummosus TaxID=1776032 RepID=A0A431TZC5_9BACT|nr:hypothetical protein [Hymenobacter gummosus]RTQ47909.1 hypothetical protein EJV47_18510 [Hymenobacter gummosus]